MPSHPSFRMGAAQPQEAATRQARQVTVVRFRDFFRLPVEPHWPGLHACLKSRIFKPEIATKLPCDGLLQCLWRRFLHVFPKTRLVPGTTATYACCLTQRGNGTIPTRRHGRSNPARKTQICFLWNQWGFGNSQNAKKKRVGSARSPST